MLVHGIESHVSVAATEFTQPLSLNAIDCVFKNITKAVKGDEKAIEEIHLTSAMTGIAIANASLGVCHALAHALEIKYNVPHGIAVLLCIIPTMIYNACKAPQKMGVMPQYKYPCSDERYAEIADFCMICDKEMSQAEKIEALIDRISQLAKEFNIPLKLKDVPNMVSKEQFQQDINTLVLLAASDSSNNCNPRLALLSELAGLFEALYE